MSVIDTQPDVIMSLIQMLLHDLGVNKLRWGDLNCPTTFSRGSEGFLFERKQPSIRVVNFGQTDGLDERTNMRADGHRRCFIGISMRVMSIINRFRSHLISIHRNLCPKGDQLLVT
jgi:hypothetical protein